MKHLRKQRADIGKYSYVNTTACPCKSHTFRKRVRKVIKIAEK